MKKIKSYVRKGTSASSVALTLVKINTNALEKFNSDSLIFRVRDGSGSPR